MRTALSLVPALVLLTRVAATAAADVNEVGDLPSAAFDGDGECLSGSGSGDAAECAVELRQLRVRGVVGAGAGTAGPPVNPAHPPVDVSPGAGSLPGGSAFADGVIANLVAENATLRAQWSDMDNDGYDDMGGSCAGYGCISYYAPWHTCQCNAKCPSFGTCCNDFSQTCAKTWGVAPAPSSSTPTPSPSHGSNVMTLYHQTSQHAATLIIKNGFRPGKSGWCGGAIYFAATKAATVTKAIGPDSSKGAMLECRVDVGKIMYLDSKCGSTAHSQSMLNQAGYDSICFNPGDGNEYVIFDKTKVLSIKQVSLS